MKWNDGQAGMISLHIVDPEENPTTRTERWIEASEIKQIQDTPHGYRVIWGYNNRVLFAVTETVQEILNLKAVAQPKIAFKDDSQRIPATTRKETETGESD